MAHQQYVDRLEIGMAEAYGASDTVGIYHLDIKPDHIMLVSNHADLAIKMAHFGLLTLFLLGRAAGLLINQHCLLCAMIRCEVRGGVL